MSKISEETLSGAIAEILKFATETKPRKFLETVELQVSLKNYDPAKDKRFSGSVQLPHVPRPKYTVTVLANQKHQDECKAAGVPFHSKADLEKLKKNKKLVKKLAASSDSFLASADLVRQVPRLLGPGLNKAGKFPAVLGNNEDMLEKVDTTKRTVKFALKSKKTTTVCLAVANVGMTAEEIEANIRLSINFLVSLLKKNWQNVRKIYIKSTMSPSHRVFGF